MRLPILIFSVLAAAALPVFASDQPAALAAFKSGDYKTALPLLQEAAAAPDKTDMVRAALLSTLVYEGHVDEAASLETTLAAEAPNSPEAIAARGEFLFYMGDVAGAEKLYRAAIKLKDETPRAYYGLYRLFRAASYYRTARTFCLRAHAIDPDDSLITLAFLRYLVGDKRKEMVGPFMQSHPWFSRGTYYQVQEENAAGVKQELADQRAFELEGGLKEATVPLNILLNGPTRARGLGIQLTLEGGKPLRLLFDTGASGILLTQVAVDRAGLKHIGSTEHWGIGDAGIRKGFFAVSDSCSIGTLQFKKCVFQANEGKGRIAGEEDGLVGADFFDDYLIHLDFQKRVMVLKPLPPRPVIPQGYDRTIPADEADFTPVFRFGHELCIPTLVNRKSSGLFLLDTGSQVSMMDTTFARLSTKLHGDEYMHVRGVSGNVKDVFAADKAELQFGHFRQSNFGLTSVNINNAGDRHQDIRLSGILGLPLLAMFRLDIDYRNGLVKFDYALK